MRGAFQGGGGLGALGGVLGGVGVAGAEVAAGDLDQHGAHAT